MTTHLEATCRLLNTKLPSLGDRPQENMASPRPLDSSLLEPLTVRLSTHS